VIWTKINRSASWAPPTFSHIRFWVQTVYCRKMRTIEVGQLNPCWSWK
jgi:hypothetical protein